MFQELGSNPATMGASKACDCFAPLVGNAGGQADATAAYTQAELKGTETWVELPRHKWPTQWEGKFSRPCCPLLLALYGHPDAGGYWEQHCENHLLSVGFSCPFPDWPSCYWHEVLSLFLVVYVDDFKLAGPIGNIPKGWALIRKGIKMDDPTDVGLYLGCEHRQSTESPGQVQRSELGYGELPP